MDFAAGVGASLRDRQEGPEANKREDELTHSLQHTISDVRHALIVLCALVIAASVAPGGGAEAVQLKVVPIGLHPDNPHYFLWRGKPTILITSGEHYGAVMNLDFDYRKYLDTLAADGMNYTRVFSGAYVEPQGAFNIARNTPISCDTPRPRASSSS
jgi:hypothetical protein